MLREELDAQMRRPPPHLSVIIPVYNEERRLPPTLDAVLDYLERQPYAAEVLVVNDGCTDGTASLVAGRAATTTLPVRLVQHADRQNHGKGAAVQCGMLAAHGGFRLFMDADNAIAIEHIERFWPRFDDGAMVVIGARDPYARSSLHPLYTWYRRLASGGGNLVIQAFVVPGVSDTQTGFKMFTAASATDVFSRLTVARWGFDVEVLVVARRLGYAITEVPVYARNQPDSKVKLLTYLQALREVWHVRRNLRAGRYD
jgi:dolichyl-phosphate beta-glucosyltransferase